LADKIEGEKKDIPWSGNIYPGTYDARIATNMLKEEIVELAKYNEPINIVSHSYGTVIAYIALNELQSNDETKHIKIDSLITMGSPLGENVNTSASNYGETMDIVKDLARIGDLKLPSKLAPLENVKGWTNVHSAGDYVSGVINVSGVKNIQIDEVIIKYTGTSISTPESVMPIPGSTRVEGVHPHAQYYETEAKFKKDGEYVLLSEVLTKILSIGSFQDVVEPSVLSFNLIPPNTSTAKTTQSTILGNEKYSEFGSELGSGYYTNGDVGGGGGGSWGDDPVQQPSIPYIPPNLPPSGNTASLNTGNNSTANSTTGNSPTAPSFKFGSNVDASGYGVQTTGLLTGAGTSATGSSPQYVAVDPTGRFAYVSNGSSNTVSVYTINQTTGALTAGTAVATGIYPQGVAVDPTGRFAYAANNSSNSISVYTINQTTGALTAGTAVATGSNPHHVAVDPIGKFVYAANYGSNSISVYTINQTTGALTAGTAVATGVAPSSVAVDPTGRFAYVSSITSQTVSVYTINQTTGALTAGTAVATEIWPLSVSIDPTGRFAYAANYGSHSISVYTINQTTGALTPVGTIATNNPYYIAFDPTGKSAYVTNGNPSPATVSTYTINQTTGMLTLLGTTATTGNFPQSIVVDPTGKYAYVTHEGINTVSNYTIDPSMQLFSSVLTGSISGTASPGGTTPITMTGSYDPTSPSSFLWGQKIYSYNGSTGQNTTYDDPPNAYAGYLTGYKADDNTMKAKWASIYVKDNGSAGIHLGTLTGTATAPNHTTSGTINKPVEMVSGGIGFTPANLYPANVVTTSLINGTPILASGNFSGAGTMSPAYRKWESLGITGQEWGVWSSVSGGSYTGPTSSGWSLSEDYNYAATKTIIGAEVKGTSWTGNKIEGTKAGYGADISTGKTWVSIGDVIGTYDPVALTYQAVGAGSWIETNKFLWMAANEPSKLQALNIPCVQVGNVNLAGSNNYGTGTMNVTMNNMKFFANTAGGPAKIWAVGQGQMGSWTGTTPPAGTAANISGGGLNATFTVKTFDVTTTNKFNATITNGTGGFNGSTTFRGAATGTINTAAKTFSGTAAGVAK